ncbi:hypothetical protein BaRGS_00026356 [Batillaria attramentaria]|uniref:Uncharacterized protein n=1 Tax=Batillaria attramentaria TaxID=370345 RepID=A0ABD0K5D2_9CAEN
MHLVSCQSVGMRCCEEEESPLTICPSAASVDREGAVRAGKPLQHPAKHCEAVTVTVKCERVLLSCRLSESGCKARGEVPRGVSVCMKTICMQMKMT